VVPKKSVAYARYDSDSSDTESEADYAHLALAAGDITKDMRVMALWNYETLDARNWFRARIMRVCVSPPNTFDVIVLDGKKKLYAIGVDRIGRRVVPVVASVAV
jgi:hypothetical protein